MKGNFKDRSKIQAKILFFWLKDMISLKLKNFFHVWHHLKPKLRVEPRKRKNVPKQENQQAYIHEGI